MSEGVRKAIHHLLSTEPFFAHFILNSQILYDKHNVPTAGAAVIKGVPTFVFNSEFMSKLSPAEAQTVVKHEVLHLVLGHLDTAKPAGYNHKIANIATDCAINQYLTNLPGECITLEWAAKMCKKPLLAFQTSDYYYNQLMQAAEKVEQSGMGTMDEHDLEVGDRGNPALNAAAVKAIAKKAVASAAGNVSADLMGQIASAPATLPWKQILRNFVMRQVASTTLNTQKKVNRRFAMPVPGKRKKRTMTLAVCTDSSGSVSDEAYAAFFGEIQSIAKQVEITWLIQADNEVKHFEKLTPKSKLSTTRKGYGGTAYQPAITKALELGCDVIIYFGDFDSSDTPVDPKVPVLWVGVGTQEPPAKFGKVVRLSA